ncbi:MAG: enoyl-CoA hydratase [Microthrixaceae bacterium]|nr:enoyl-CoA hydratase [Microthrixaceae bacterium]
MPYILIERQERVAVVTINDPERRNALNLDLNEELITAFDELERDDGIGAIVVTGTPPAFCAGADLSRLGSAHREGLEAIYRGFLRVSEASKPTVAAVNGAAVGAGMNLALACDLRLAAPSARFDTRFLDLGLHPGGGHTWMMRRILGPQATMATVLFGQALDGAEAERVGLVWRCVEDDSLIETAIAMAGRAASGPHQLVPQIKATIQTMAGVATHTEAVQVELGPQVWSLNQPDFAERIAALQQRISGSR